MRENEIIKKKNIAEPIKLCGSISRAINLIIEMDGCTTMGFWLAMYRDKILNRICFGWFWNIWENILWFCGVEYLFWIKLSLFAWNYVMLYYIEIMLLGSFDDIIYPNFSNSYSHITIQHIFEKRDRKICCPKTFQKCADPINNWLTRVPSLHISSRSSPTVYINPSIPHTYLSIYHKLSCSIWGRKKNVPRKKPKPCQIISQSKLDSINFRFFRLPGNTISIMAFFATAEFTENRLTTFPLPSHTTHWRGIYIYAAVWKSRKIHLARTVYYYYHRRQPAETLLE